MCLKEIQRENGKVGTYLKECSIERMVRLGVLEGGFNEVLERLYVLEGKFN